MLIRWRIQRVCSLMNDATPARPTNWQLSLRVDRWTSPPGAPHPLGINNYCPVNILGLPTPNSRRPPAGGFAYRPSLNNCRSSVQLFITLLDSKKFNATKTSSLGQHLQYWEHYNFPIYFHHVLGTESFSILAISSNSVRVYGDCFLCSKCTEGKCALCCIFFNRHSTILAICLSLEVWSVMWEGTI